MQIVFRQGGIDTRRVQHAVVQHQQSGMAQDVLQHVCTGAAVAHLVDSEVVGLAGMMRGELGMRYAAHRLPAPAVQCATVGDDTGVGEHVNVPALRQQRQQVQQVGGDTRRDGRHRGEDRQPQRPLCHLKTCTTFRTCYNFSF